MENMKSPEMFKNTIKKMHFCWRAKRAEKNFGYLLRKLRYFFRKMFANPGMEILPKVKKKQ